MKRIITSTVVGLLGLTSVCSYGHDRGNYGYVQRYAAPQIERKPIWIPPRVQYVPTPVYVSRPSPIYYTPPVQVINEVTIDNPPPVVYDPSKYEYYNNCLELTHNPIVCGQAYYDNQSGVITNSNN